ncbi:Metallo-dependent phosphatase [Aspergillus floccosus]
MTTTAATKKIFPFTTLISDLPTNFISQPLPSSSENGPANGRLVIIGDIKSTLTERKGDHLVLVGDLVNKGPDSPGVVDLAIKLGASAVRGNHENAVLNANAEVQVTSDNLAPSGGLPGSSHIPRSAEVDKFSDTLEGFEASVASGLSSGHSATTLSTALALSRRQLDWLAALPLILRVKLPHNLASPFGATLLIVHAGLVPGIPLEEQDPYAIMHMRSLVCVAGDNDQLMPTEVSGEESWVTAWDRWQDKLAPKTTVIFGHDAKRRLQLGRYAIGLDTACLYGHQLSAAVIAAPDGQIECQIIQTDYCDAPVVPTVPLNQSNETPA